MDDNIFFDTKKLKYRGENVIIGKAVRIRYPELVELHDNVVIDDFTHISCGLIVGEHVLIENNCSFMGGKNFKVVIGKHSGIANHSSFVCANIDFKRSINFNHNRELLRMQSMGDIVLEDMVGIGAHSIILPNVTIGEGSRISEYTRVNRNLEPWGLYHGISAKRIGPTDKETVMADLAAFNKATGK